jgi:fructosamine-3-kinase/nicotinic acid mononucleotide adenylyltransferase
MTQSPKQCSIVQARHLRIESRVHKGRVNECYIVSCRDSTKRYFLKWRPDLEGVPASDDAYATRPVFEAEVQDLKLLSRLSLTTPVRVASTNSVPETSTDAAADKLESGCFMGTSDLVSVPCACACPDMTHHFIVPQPVECTHSACLLDLLPLLPQSETADHYERLARALAHLHAQAHCVPRPTGGWGWSYNHYNGRDQMCDAFSPSQAFADPGGVASAVHDKNVPPGTATGVEGRYAAQGSPSWWTFFKVTRLHRRLEQLRTDAPELLHIWALGMRLYDVGHLLFPGTLPVQPSLLHGDFNCDNWGVHANNGQICLFDPTLLIGDAEYDLAAFTCFGPSAQNTETFLDSYRCIRPLSTQWKQREQLYHFYFLLSGFVLTRNSSLLKRAGRVGVALAEQLPCHWPSLVSTARLLCPRATNVEWTSRATSRLLGPGVTDVEYKGQSAIALNKVVSRCEDESQPLAVLVLFGTFSPVHRNHVRLLDTAANWLRQRGYHVVGGFLSPSLDTRATRKLRGRHIAAFERVELIRKALADTCWDVDLTQLDQFDGARNIYSVVSRHLGLDVSAESSARTKLELFVVCGSDTLDFLSQHLNPLWRILCVTRHGASVKADTNGNGSANVDVNGSKGCADIHFDAGDGGKTVTVPKMTPRIQIVHDSEQATMSSTNVRSWLGSWWDAQVKGDRKQRASFDAKLRGVLTPAVLEHLQRDLFQRYKSALILALSKRISFGEVECVLQYLVVQ